MLKVRTTLTRYGFGIVVEDLPRHELSTILYDLSVHPISHPDFPPPLPLEVFNWSPSRKILRVPKAWGIKRFGQPDCESLSSNKINIEFTGAWRPDQIEPFEKTKSELLHNKSGILCLGTGSGKTAISIGLICSLGVKTLVLVHKIDLVHQWADEIGCFAPKAKIGKFCTNHRPAMDDDIVIATLHSMTQPSNIDLNRDKYGFTIIDECQYVCATTFSRAFFLLNSEYTLAISATPQRRDGMHTVLHMHVGDIIYSRPSSVEGHFLKVDFVHLETKRKSGYDIRLQKSLQSKRVTELADDQARHQKILNFIRPIVNNTNNFVLVFCERIAQAKQFYEELRIVSNRTIGLKIAGKKRSELEKDIICTTYASMGCGNSIPRFNTAIFVSPKSNEELIDQALGRILRKKHENGAYLIDIVDSFQKNKCKMREAVYRYRMQDQLVINHVHPQPSDQ